MTTEQPKETDKPTTTTNAPPIARRKIHMDVQECFNRASTSEGAQTLKLPLHQSVVNNGRMAFPVRKRRRVQARTERDQTTAEGALAEAGNDQEDLEDTDHEPEQEPAPPVLQQNGTDQMNDSDDDDLLLAENEILSQGTNKYGLPSQDDGTPVQYFDHLPTEILNTIFSNVPYMDLALNLNLVCKRWHEIIDSPLFCPWKRLYHRVKAGYMDDRSVITHIMNQNGMIEPKSYLVGLIKYMRHHKPTTARLSLSCLSHCEEYKLAVAMFNERIPECIEDEEPNPWATFTAMMINAPSVEVMVRLILLVEARSLWTLTELTECCYHIAAFLLVFSKLKFNGPWQAMHYRLFYSLYLYEGTTPIQIRLPSASQEDGRADDDDVTEGNVANVAPTRDISKIPSLTPEQQRIVSRDLKDGETMKIIAFAGTGKTTTLIKYTKHNEKRLSQRFLLIVFNKSVQVQASRVFPINVSCRTGHSLAWKPFGERYKGNLGSAPTVHKVSKAIKMREGMDKHVRAKCIVITLKKYIASAENDITISHHVPLNVLDKDKQWVQLSPDNQKEVLQDAKKYWGMMCDMRNRAVQMTFDGYFKLYQLSKPCLEEYDCILIDEAQDLTPAVQDVIFRQRRAKIMVGDPRQQIYSFRGAVDALSRFTASCTYYLTQSFRFGPEVAYVANSCLTALHEPSRKTLVGCLYPGRGAEKDEQVAVITRTNYELFRRAQRYLSDEENLGKSIFIVGGIEKFGFDVIEDIYYLSLPSNERHDHVIKNSIVAQYDTLAELINYAETAEDNEMLSKIKIVKTYTKDTVAHIQLIKQRTTGNQDAADFIFTTAHKAKGLEFATVVLGDDFIQCGGARTNYGERLTDQAVRRIYYNLGKDENNLLYVAVTRAKKKVIGSQNLISLLEKCGDMFVTPVASSELLREVETPTLTCFKADAAFEPYTMTLVRKNIVGMKDPTKRSDSAYGPKYVKHHFPDLAELYGILDKDDVNPEDEPDHHGNDLLDLDEMMPPALMVMF